MSPLCPSVFIRGLVLIHLVAAVAAGVISSVVAGVRTAAVAVVAGAATVLTTAIIVGARIVGIASGSGYQTGCLYTSRRLLYCMSQRLRIFGS